ncbi:hypothetical protein [Paracoccus sp. IB05]|uniref:hypothetical protein n=1 Tax=Paracoccus sp. IB05 TaxID=2779367 RepID=UPI0018E7CE53|nr:hypothetical protein [Paracoccus sp. IB05]MBJ2151574.1 hypothetical protein [Paracoccus sp. IB05]
MKAMLFSITESEGKFGHNLQPLHDELAKYIGNLNLSHLVKDVQCSAATRYGEEVSTKAQAFQAHKSSLLIARTLGHVLLPSED